jgi:hypothetical protein
MRCYHDGSYGDDGSGDSWVTLGGVAATDAAWNDFDTKWNRMLKERYPVAPYIHMIELTGHESPFDVTNGWSLSKKRQLIEDAIVILSQMDKNEFRWFRCSVNQSAVDRLYRRGEYVPLDPHKHCALVLAEMMVNSYWRNCPDPESIFLCYDRNGRFVAGIRKEWLARKTPPAKGRTPQTNCWDRIENILDADQAYTPPLQVADMVSWAHTRTLPTDEERVFSGLKDLLVKFVPATRLDITEKIIAEYSQMLKRGGLANQ